MNKDGKLVSICIPSYNRPVELRRLLESIDAKKHKDDIEIVICEDKSPNRPKIGEQVREFMSKSDYNVVYHENEENLGYDRNLKNLIRRASGEYIIFMGDDDLFIEGALDQYLDFVVEHSNCGYILRSYVNETKDGKKQIFRYFKEEKELIPGDDAYITMFTRSVFISGFTIKREYAINYETSQFDGSLLYQLYLLAEVCRIYPSINCNILLTKAIEWGTPFFGSSKTEKGLYTPGTITVDNSINFMKWYVTIIKYMGDKYHSDSADKTLMEMSKYIYPVLSIQRNKGRKEFSKYAKRLREIGLDKSRYFDFYYCTLLIFGKKTCDTVVRNLKNAIGRRPKL